MSGSKGADAPKGTPGAKAPDGREWVFRILAMSLPFVALGLLEAGLRLGGYRGDTSLFVGTAIEGPGRMVTNPTYTSRYFFYTRTLPNPSQDVFLEQKPEDGYRVFALGGSSAAGYPYGFNGMFSRVVADVLTDVMPDRTVEVVNVATSAINTYTLVDQLDEILAMQPDLLLLYTGHNEFYGALGVASNERIGRHPGFVHAYLRLQRLKTFMLLRDGFTGLQRALAAPLSADGREESGTLMERIVAEQTIPLDGDLYRAGMEQFRHNLAHILERASEAGVDIVVGTLASNLKDHAPFISLDPGTTSDSADDPTAASADGAFQRARDLAAVGEWDAARPLFEQARDLDALRFRAPGAWNGVIVELAERHGAVVAEVEAELAGASPGGVIGGELMLEHLHPNSEGYFLLGKAFALALERADYFGQATAAQARRDWRDYRERMRLTPLDERVAWHRIEYLMGGWPFVMDPAERRNYTIGYRPSSVMDSLAFLVVHRGLPWDKAKVDYADRLIADGRIDEALAEYDGLHRNQPWNDSPLLYAARLLLDRNRFDQARPYLEQAYALTPDHPYVNKMLGAVEVNDGNLQRGRSLLTRAVELAPDDAQAWFNLSGAHALLGDYEAAGEAADRVMRLNPRFPGLRQWLAQLESLR